MSSMTGHGAGDCMRLYCHRLQDTDSLDELFGSATSSGTMFDGDWAQSEALAAEIMPHLFGGDDSFCGQQAFNTGFDALASCETELFLNQVGCWSWPPPRSCGTC